MTAQQNEHCELQQLLQTDTFGRTHRYLSTVTSTNDVARSWADKGAPEGTLIWTEEQTEGRGRYGRCWTANRGENLTFSVILRPDIPIEEIPLLPLITGLSVASSLDTYLGDACSLKWPNDVLFGEAKCAGILCESFGPGGDVDTVILGIGVNVNQTNFEGAFERRPTSLAKELGRPIERTPLLASILKELENRYAKLEHDLDGLLEEYETRMAYIGVPIQMNQPKTDNTVCGICLGISRGGGLMVETSTETRTVFAGDVSFGRITDK